MKNTIYPYIALGLGITLLIVLSAATALAADGKPALPLLTLLLISEFGFVVTGIAAVVGIRAINTSPRRVMMALTSLACTAMSVRFVLLGLEFWPL